MMLNPSNLFKWRQPKPIYISYEDIPDTLATASWLTKRGYLPTPPIKGYFQSKHKKLPLYAKEQAKPFIQGADLSFQGRYLTETQPTPPHLKPLDYFQRHQLPLPSVPTAKQLVGEDFINLYPLSNVPLTLTQRQELETQGYSFLSDTIYHCSLEELPNDLKTKSQLRQYGLKNLPPMKGQLLLHQKLHPLYSFEESFALQTALTQTPSSTDILYQSLKHVPHHLATYEWLDHRGYRPTPSVQAFVKLTDSLTIPLFLKDTAQPLSPASDLTFKGRYYSPSASPKDNFKPIPYFHRHGLSIPAHPIAKQRCFSQGLINLYKLPITPLTRSQRQELEIELGYPLLEIVYLCEWRELPPHLKTPSFFNKHHLPLPTNPVAQLVMNGKLFDLYEIRP